MKQIKHAALALAMVGMLSAQAHASEAQMQSPQDAKPVVAFSQTDISAMFEQADKPMQLVALSPQEMKETEGAIVWAPYVGRIGIGFASGFGGSALSQYYNTGQVNWTSAAYSGLYGAGIGGASRFLANRGWF